MSTRMFCALVLLGVLLPSAADAQPRVETQRAPHNGYRPQAIIDAEGVLHVVQGDASKRGDLFYTQRKPGGQFSKPIQVNKAGKITAAFSMSIGKGGRVHVLIRPTPVYLKLKMPEKKKLRMADLKYMLYCRLNDEGTAFSEERDLAAGLKCISMEGCGAVLADGEDNVYVFWHAQVEGGRGEASRKIYRTVSSDGGETFGKPTTVKGKVTGACACCPLVGLLDGDRIVLALRNSVNLAAKEHTKDAYLLVSEDKGESFKGTKLEAWKQAGCPGATFTLTKAESGLFVGWRTRKQVKFVKEGWKKMISPTQGGNTRAPVIAVNKDGVVLFAWGVRAKNGMHVVWQLFDAKGKALGKKSVIQNGLNRKWGSLAALARSDGSFLILHDGNGKKAGGGG